MFVLCRIHHCHHITVAIFAKGTCELQLISHITTVSNSAEHAFRHFFALFLTHRLMLVLMPASWDGLWLPTVLVRWWLHPFLAFGPTTVHAGSR